MLLASPDSLAPSYVRQIANKYTGAVADQAEKKRMLNTLISLGSKYTPIDIETIWVPFSGKQAISFLRSVSKRCPYLVSDDILYSSIIIVQH